MALFRRAGSLVRLAMRGESLGFTRGSAACISSISSWTRPFSSSSDDDVLGSVRDILAAKGNSKHYSIRSDAMVIDAVREMVKHNIGSMIIVDDKDKPVSMLTESDYMKKMPNQSSDGTRVSEIMSQKEFTYVSPDSSLMDAMEAMAVRNIRHVPVIQDGAILGMVSVGDCVKELVARHRKDAQHMRDFISGGY